MVHAKDQQAPEVFAGCGDWHPLNANAYWYLVFHIDCMQHLGPARNPMLTLEQKSRIATNKNAAQYRKAQKDMSVLNLEAMRDIVITREQKIRIAVNKRAAQDRNAARVRKLKEEATRAEAENAEIVFKRKAIILVLVCRICKKTFKTSAGLLRHLLRVEKLSRQQLNGSRVHMVTKSEEKERSKKNPRKSRSMTKDLV